MPFADWDVKQSHPKRCACPGGVSLAFVGALAFVVGLPWVAALQIEADEEKAWSAFVKEHCVERHHPRGNLPVAYCDNGMAYPLKASAPVFATAVPTNAWGIVKKAYQPVPLPLDAPLQGYARTEFFRPQRGLWGAALPLRAQGVSWQFEQPVL